MAISMLAGIIWNGKSTLHDISGLALCYGNMKIRLILYCITSYLVRAANDKNVVIFVSRQFLSKLFLKFHRFSNISLHILCFECPVVS